MSALVKSATPTFQNSGRLPSLDGLRGVAILLVLLTHGSYMLPAALAPFADHGRLGVSIFFALSGFLIYCLSARELAETGDFRWRQFYLRRIFRIFPSYYGYLLFVFLLAQLGQLHLPPAVWLAAATFVTNYGAVYTTAPAADYHVIGHYWTLALEEQFYLTWPLLILLLKRRRLLPVLICIMAVAPAVRIASYFLIPSSRGQLGGMFHTSFDSIAGGVLLVVALTDERIQGPLIKIVRSTWLVVAALVFLFWGSPALLARFHGGYTLSVGQTLEIAAICFLIASAMTKTDGWLFRSLNWPPLAYIGVLSYSLYIWNNFFLREGGVHWFNQFPWSILGLIGAALLSYYCIEKPFLRLKRRFENRGAVSLRIPTPHVAQVSQPVDRFGSP